MATPYSGRLQFFLTPSLGRMVFGITPSLGRGVFRITPSLGRVVFHSTPSLGDVYGKKEKDFATIIPNQTQYMSRNATNRESCAKSSSEPGMDP